MKLLLTLAVLLGALAPGASFAAAPPLLLGSGSSYPLAGHLEQLVDPGGKLTLADILSPAVAARFTPIPGNMNRGYSRDAIWLKFRAARTAAFPEQGYLCLDPRHLDWVTIYAQAGDDPAAPRSFVETRMGDHVPLGKDEVRSTDFVIPLTLPQDAPRTVYLRVQSTSSLTLVGTVHSPSSLVSHDNLRILLNGGYVAVAMLIVLLNLLFYLRLRDRLYLYFSLNILFLSMNHVGMSGLLPFLLPLQTHLISDYLVGCGFGLTVCVYMLFVIRLFRLPPGSWMRRFFGVIFSLGGLTVFSVPLGIYGDVASVTFFALLVSIILLTGLSIRAIRQKEPGGFLYLSAFGLSNLGYAVQILRVLGMLPAHWWSLHASHMASLCNMVLMTLALTERVHAAEEMALTAAREAEQKAVELAEGMTEELREKQRRLEVTLERQTRFVDMISHEYRTPLAIATVNLGIIEQRGIPEGMPAEPLRKLGRAVKRMAEVFDLVLERTRQDVEVTRVNLGPVNLTEFAVSLVRAARELRPERVIEFTPAAVPTIMADQGLLGTALLNLIDNADKYSPEEGVITLALAADGEGAVIEVRDEGPGFRPGEREQVFEKYRRGSASAGTSGVGIGLWLVREIVTAHGGSMTVGDNHPRGAVVTVRLPVGAGGCSERA